MAGGRIAIVLKGYPRLSETFIAQEIEALERRGLELEIWSLRRPTDTARHPVHEAIAAKVHYLPEYLRDQPGRVARAWWRARRRPGYARARRQWWRDFGRDPTRNRIRRFGQALVLAAEIDGSVAHLHAHFLHTPASVARYAAMLLDRPWSVSAHAKDIWTTPAWDQAEKLADCAWAVTCTAAGRRHLQALAPGAEIALVYHGLDLRRFAPPPARPPAGGPLRLLSVGRAVEKKGYPDLIAALSRLPAGLDWHLTHIGGGPLLDDLKAEAAAAGIAGRIDWRGPQPQGEVLAACRAADLFVLASRIAADGDRDGLPNVLLEAASQELAIVATRVSGVPELIRDGESGRLVPPAEPVLLAQAIAELAADPAQRHRLGQAAGRRLRADFDLERCVAPLARRFGPAAPEPTAVTRRRA